MMTLVQLSSSASFQLNPLLLLLLFYTSASLARPFTFYLFVGHHRRQHCKTEENGEKVCFAPKMVVGSNKRSERSSHELIAQVECRHYFTRLQLSFSSSSSSSSHQRDQIWSSHLDKENFLPASQPGRVNRARAPVIGLSYCLRRILRSQFVVFGPILVLILILVLVVTLVSRHTTKMTSDVTFARCSFSVPPSIYLLASTAAAHCCCNFRRSYSLLTTNPRAICRVGPLQLQVVCPLSSPLSQC